MTLGLAACSKPEEVISSRIALANQKLEAGNVEQAVDVLESLDRKYPDQPAVLEALAFAHARSGKHDAAARCFVRASDRDPASSVLRQLAAEAFLQAGEPARAAEQHRLYLDEFPGDFQSWQKLGEIEEQRGDVARAIDAYLEWYRLRPTGECAYRLGAAFRKLNNAPQAKTWFEATIKHGEAFIEESLLGLLELEVEAGHLAAAEKTVGQLDNNFPGSLEASPLAGVRQRIAAWKEAEQALAEARAEQQRLTRELEEARRARVREIEEAVRRENEAKAALEKAAADPGPTEEPSETATSGTVAEAVSTEAAAPGLDTPPVADLPPALAAAIERKERGEITGAIEMIWRELSTDDSRVEFWTELADCYRQLKQYAPAEACILEARRRAPDSVEVETAYLNVVRESQSTDVYLTRVEAARRKFPGNANFAYVLARELAAAQGDAVRTIAAFEDFLLLADPRDPRRSEAADFLARARR